MHLSLPRLCSTVAVSSGVKISVPLQRPGRTITYSPGVTVVPTYDCFNKCSYCSFRQNVGSGSGDTLSDIRRRLEVLSGSGISEVLVLSGEMHPRSKQREQWWGMLMPPLDPPPTNANI